MRWEERRTLQGRTLQRGARRSSSRRSRMLAMTLALTHSEMDDNSSASAHSVRSSGSTAANASAAAKTEASVRQLEAAFPGLPRQILHGVLGAVKGDADAAAGLLMQMMNEQDSSKQKKTKTKDAPQAPPPMPDGSARSAAELYGSGLSTCGYCHSPKKGRTSFGMVCATLTPLDYQALIDLGWRRSGDYLYKQNNTTSCCANYTIRLNVHKFRPSKGQRHALNRFERFLRGEDVHADKQTPEEAAENPNMSDVTPTPTPAVAVDPHQERIRTELQSAVESLVVASKLPASLTPDLYSKQLRVYVYVDPATGKKSASAAAASTAAAPAAPTFQYSTNLALILSGILRKQKQEVSAVAIAQLLAQQLTAASTVSATTPIESFVAEPLGYLNFRIEGAQPARPRSKSQDAEGVAVHKKLPFQKRSPAEAAAASSSSAAAAASSSVPPSVAHTFEIRQVPATFDPVAFELYKKYQIAIHKDKPAKLTPDQYTGFLCHSPLVQQGPYGGFHHHYLLDGHLIAVGVVDVLPSCLSSVYLFYDPALEHLNLGTVTALKEIEHIRTKLMPQYPQCKYYYLGYYIHSCIKMAYKGKFSPAELLCPVRNTWHLREQCLPALESFDGIPSASVAAAIAAGTAVPKKGCVILSDVAPESREEDGSAPTYLSPSLVQHVAPSAPGAEKKKRKKKKKKAKSPAATAAAAATPGEGDEDEDEEEPADMADVKTDATKAAPAAAAAAPSAASSAAAASSSSAAAASAASASTSPSASGFPVIDAAHPYVFNVQSKLASDSHRLSVAQACESAIPVWIKGKLYTFGQLTKQGQAQMKSVVYEYASLAGSELATRIALKL